MSKFYGSIVGNRGMATRGGSADSGFRATCQSYDGSIIVSMDYDSDNKLYCRVGTHDSSGFSTDWNSKDFVGTFEEFKAALHLLNDIKNGDVSVVRHRKK